jgi:hypothetical protein
MAGAALQIPVLMAVWDNPSLTSLGAAAAACLQVVPTPWGMMPAVPAGMPPMWMRPGMMPVGPVPYPIAYQQVRLWLLLVMSAMRSAQAGAARLISIQCTVATVCCGLHSFTCQLRQHWC